MPAMRLRDPETIKEVIASFSRYRSLSATASAFGASISGVRALLRIHAPELLEDAPVAGKKVRLTKQQMAEIQDAFRRTRDIRRTADLTKLSPEVVETYLRNKTNMLPN